LQRFIGKAAAAFLFAALVPAMVAAAPPAPPPAILKLATAVLRATNTDDISAFAGLYASDAVVVDENPPFAWHGANAGAAWWRVVEGVMQKMKMPHLKAAHVRISEFRQSSTDAYMVQSMTITGSAAGKPFAESGTMTYTFHNAGGTWVISSQVWTTKP
jgi:ketosteroid isomerase-like protein